MYQKKKRGFVGADRLSLHVGVCESPEIEGLLQEVSG